MEALASTAIEHATRLIALASSASHRIAARRSAIAWLLHVGPLLNHELRLAFAQHPLYDALVWYERVCHGLGSAGRGFFFDRVPASVVLFGIPASVGLPNSGVGRMTALDAINDRFATCLKLEAVSPYSESAQQLYEAHHAPDLPSALPPQVRVFVSRARAVCNGLRATGEGRHFVQCENAACGRVFCVPSGHAHQHQHQEQRRRSSASSPSHERYLEALGLHRRDVNLTQRFCCAPCANEWLAQADAAVPDVERWLPPALPSPSRREDVSTGTTSGRSAAELRRALRRNAEFQRHRKEANAGTGRQQRPPRQCRRFPALGGRVVKRMQRAFVDAMDVDTAALYLAAVLAESSLLRSRKLPGAHPDWRSTPGACALARRLLALQRSVGEERTSGTKAPIESTVPAPMLLRRVRARAHALRVVATK